MIRILLGLVGPDNGEAWVLGSRVPCPERLAEIGALMEEPALYPDVGAPEPRRDRRRGGAVAPRRPRAWRMGSVWSGCRPAAKKKVGT